jgi:hypothetical protein
MWMVNFTRQDIYINMLKKKKKGVDEHMLWTKIVLVSYREADKWQQMYKWKKGLD